ncbi:unnamed protein product, partial [Brenthis ino]
MLIYAVITYLQISILDSKRWSKQKHLQHLDSDKHLLTRGRDNHPPSLKVVLLIHHLNHGNVSNHRNLGRDKLHRHQSVDI